MFNLKYKITMKNLKINIEFTDKLKKEIEVTPDEAKELYDFIYCIKSLKDKHLSQIEEYLAEVDPNFFD